MVADYSFHTYAPDVLTFSGAGFTLSSGYDWQTDRNRVDYSDDDAVFNGDENNDNSGDDNNQVGTAYDDQGNVVQSGQVYVQEYAIVEAPDGSIIWLDRIEIDGVHVGYIPSEPLTPGVTYTYVGGGNVGPYSSSTGDSNELEHAYYDTNSVPCLERGTRVLTPSGWKAAETIEPGDMIETLDHGPQEVVWAFHEVQRFTAACSAKPIEIKKGALGPGYPARDLVVSPQHRILLGHDRQCRDLSNEEVLVAAKALADLPGVRVMNGKRRVDWVHLACATHEVMRAEGAWVDTLLLGPTCVAGLPVDQQNLLRMRFRRPGAPRMPLNGPAARRLLPVRRAKAQIRKSMLVAA